LLLLHKLLCHLITPYNLGAVNFAITHLFKANRGNKDAIDCLKSAEGVIMIAMADIFQDRIDKALSGTHPPVFERRSMISGCR